MPEADLAIYRLDGSPGSWTKLATTADPQGNTLTASSTEVGRFAASGKQPFVGLPTIFAGE